MFWVEFDAWHTLVLTITLFEECPRHGVDCVRLCPCDSVLICKHFKVELENIDDLIWLEGLFDPVSYSVDEFVQLFVHFAVFKSVCFHFVDKVAGFILNLGIYASVVVSLRLKRFHLVGCLQTDLQLLTFYKHHIHVGTFLLDSQVVGVLGSFFFNHLKIVITEFSPRLRHPDPYKRPKIILSVITPHFCRSGV